MRAMMDSRAVQWAAGAVTLIMCASLIRLGETSLAVGLIPSPWDKLAHAGTFGVIAFALWLACGRRWLVACAAFGMALACYDEWRQLFLPGREADLLDLTADGVGVLIAAVIARRLFTKDS